MNKLIYINERNEAIVFNEHISEKEIEDFLIAKDNLTQVMNSIDYYNIVKDNIIELMQAIVHCDHKEKKVFATINRYFFNMANSFYCYVQYYKRFYYKYNAVFSEQFDKYDTYKIISELRKYTTHCFMAITKVEIDLLTGNVCIQIDPKDLLEKDESMLRKDIKKILKSQTEKGEVIDLKLLTSDFLNIFCELQLKIMNEMKGEILRDLKIVERFIYIEELNKRESYILKEDGSIINTSGILFLILEKLKEEYAPTDSIMELLKEINGNEGMQRKYDA